MDQHKYRIAGCTLLGTVVGAAVGFALYKRFRARVSSDESDEGIGDVDSIVSEAEDLSAPLANVAMSDAKSDIILKSSNHEYKDAISSTSTNAEAILAQSGQSGLNYYDSSEMPPDGSISAHNAEQSSLNTEQWEGNSISLKSKKVLLLGMDECGKSSLLNILAKRPENTKYQRTQGFNAVQIEWKGLALSIMEVGGGEETRKYWNHFTNDTKLFVFMMDGSNPERFDEGKTKLIEVLSSSAISDVPCLLISNKQDVPGAKKASSVFTENDLTDIGKTGNCDITLLDTCCVVSSDVQTTLPETILNVLVDLLSEN